MKLAPSTVGRCPRAGISIYPSRQGRRRVKQSPSYVNSVPQESAKSFVILRSNAPHSEIAAREVSSTEDPLSVGTYLVPAEYKT